MARAVIPLSQRPLDYLYILFFIINLTIITYIVDYEQLAIPTPWPEPGKFTYPVWPPAWWVDTIHHYARTRDPLLLARPVWWKVFIAVDCLFFGPCYAVFLYAFIKGKDWVRMLGIVYASVICTIVITICTEELYGPTPAVDATAVLLLNAPWFLLPFGMLVRFVLSEHPFTREAKAGKTA